MPSQSCEGTQFSSRMEIVYDLACQEIFGWQAEIYQHKIFSSLRYLKWRLRQMQATVLHHFPLKDGHCGMVVGE